MYNYTNIFFFFYALLYGYNMPPEVVLWKLSNKKLYGGVSAELVIQNILGSIIRVIHVSGRGRVPISPDKRRSTVIIWSLMPLPDTPKTTVTKKWM